jgi:hypothetical protein
MNANELDQQIGSILEAWINRDVDDDQCRFCNEQLDEPAPPGDRYCDDECEAAMDQVFDARIAIGKRDMEQRGYD